MNKARDKLACWAFTILAAALASTGCAPSTTPNGGGTSPEAKPTVVLTVLYTTDEHGWIKPNPVEGINRGGVAQLLTKLTRQEAHCSGVLPGATEQGASPASCEDSSTVLLSGGDNYTGPAISTFFRGRSMAESMGRLGYQAAAFGNHELDFGREQFFSNRRLAGLTYLAANLTRRDGKPQDLTKPYVIIERQGVKLGVVGIATPTTPKTATAFRFAELRFADIESTLATWMPRVWATGVDAVVLLAHECHDVVSPILARHPEWDLSFAGTGHCHRTSVEVVSGTPVIGPDWRLEHYARVRLRIDPSKPARKRAALLDYELVEVASPVDKPMASVDPKLDAQIASWDAKVNAALGEVIGFSSSGMAKKSAIIGRWITEAWRQRFSVDLAISTQGAIRQGLPPGPISLATVASILPFENNLVLCEVSGAALVEMLRDPEALVAGADRNTIDPAKRYRVVTTDFLFYGGDGYTFHQHDPKPTHTNQSWRQPVIDWTRGLKTSNERPLEQALSDSDVSAVR